MTTSHPTHIVDVNDFVVYLLSSILSPKGVEGHWSEAEGSYNYELSPRVDEGWKKIEYLKPKVILLRKETQTQDDNVCAPLLFTSSDKTRPEEALQRTFIYISKGVGNDIRSRGLGKSGSTMLRFTQLLREIPSK